MIANYIWTLNARLLWFLFLRDPCLHHRTSSARILLEMSCTRIEAVRRQLKPTTGHPSYGETSTVVTSLRTDKAWDIATHWPWLSHGSQRGLSFGTTTHYVYNKLFRFKWPSTVQAGVILHALSLVLFVERAQ